MTVVYTLAALFFTLLFKLLFSLSQHYPDIRLFTDERFVFMYAIERQNILKGCEIATNFVSQNSARNYLYLSNVGFD